MISKAAFALFMAENGSEYPHNDVRQTRRGLYPRWLLLEAEQDVSLFHPRGYFLLRTSCLSNDLMQHIIVNKEGIPLPDDYNEVADVMECWGISISGLWQQNALHMMHEFLTHGEQMDTPHLHYQCVVLIVERRLRELFHDNSVVTDVIESFQLHFYRQCREQTHDFYHLALDSLSFLNIVLDVEGRPNQSNQPNVIPAVVVSEEEE